MPPFKHKMPVVQDLLVAAGGGGDVIAAYMLASRDHGPRPVIATWAWDRLVVDPIPGPRSVKDFDGLISPAPDVHIFKATTRPIAPAGSTLPRLAAELDAELLLLDPTEGCRGLARQIRAAADWSGVKHITVVDVGGDALAKPGDPGLRSPLADITTVVATVATSAFAELVVIGPGCDGELSPELVRNRLSDQHAQVLPCIEPSEANLVIPVLEWHPSEATALVAMSALGYRGRVEIRDRGLPIDLSERTAEVWRIKLDSAPIADSLRAAIAQTRSLHELETVFKTLYGINEIDYERKKAGAPSQTTEPREAVAQFLASATDRGTQWVTRRRLREAVGHLPEELDASLLIPTQ